MEKQTVILWVFFGVFTILSIIGIGASFDKNNSVEDREASGLGGLVLGGIAVFIFYLIKFIHS